MSSQHDHIGGALKSAVEYVEWLVSVHPDSPESTLETLGRPTALAVATVLLPPDSTHPEKKTFAKTWQTMRNKRAHRFHPQKIATLKSRLALSAEQDRHLRDLVHAWNTRPPERSYDERRVAEAIAAVAENDGDTSPTLSRAEIGAHNHRLLAELTESDWLTLDLAPMPRRVEVSSQPAAKATERSFAWDPRGLPSRIVLIRARAGMGKTSLLRDTFVSLTTAFERAPGGDTDAPLPLLLDLPHMLDAWSSTPDSADAYQKLAAATSHEDELPRQFARRTATLRNFGDAAPGLFLLIDTADNPSGDDIRQLRDFLDVAKSKSWHVVLAGRRGQIDDIELLPASAVTVSLLPPEWADIDDFIRRATISHPLRAAAVTSIIKADQSIAALVRVPLFLRALTTLAERLPSTITRASLLVGLLQEAIGEPDPTHPPFKDIVAVLGAADLELGSPWRALKQGFEQSDYVRATRSAALAARHDHGHADTCVATAVRKRVLTVQSIGLRPHVLWRHRLLQATAMALVLNTLTPDQAWQRIHPHLLFDRGWTDVIPLYAGLGGGNEFVERILDEPDDAFLRLTHLAAECLLELPPDMRSGIEKRIVDRLAEGARRADSVGRRCSEWLGRLVEHGMGYATERVDLALLGRGIPWHTRVRLWRALHERGDDRAVIDLAAAIASSRNGLILHLAALAELAPTMLAPLLDQLIQERKAPAELVAAVVPSAANDDLASAQTIAQHEPPRDFVTAMMPAIPRDDLASAQTLVATLREPRSGLVLRRQLARALSRLPLARPLLAGAVTDARLPWSVRAGVATGLLESGAPANGAMAELAQSPNLEAPARADLLAALATAGANVLDESIALMHEMLTYESRRALTKALLTLSDGPARLRDLVQQRGLQVSTEMCALLEAGDAWAAENFRDEIARCEPSLAVQVNIVAAALSLDTPGASNDARRLLNELRLDIPDDVEDAALAFARKVDVQLLDPAFAVELIEAGLAPVALKLVAQATATGSDTPTWLLGLIDADLAPEPEFRLVVALARSFDRLPPSAQVRAERFLDRRDVEPWRLRAVAVEMVRSGHTSDRVLDILLGLVKTASREQMIEVFLNTDSVTEPQAARAVTNLHELPTGHEVRINAEHYADLEWSVGSELFGFLTDSQIAEFEQLAELGDDSAQSDFVDEVVPWYPDLIHALAAAAAAEPAEADVPVGDVKEPRAGRPAPADPTPPSETPKPPVDREQLEDWMSRGQEYLRSGQAGIDVQQHSWIAQSAELHLSMIPAADVVGRAWRFFLFGGRSRMLLPDEYPASDVQRHALRALEGGDGHLLIDCSAANFVMDPDPASAFYACLGSLLIGDDTAALWYAYRSCDLMSDSFALSACLQARRTLEEFETLHSLDDRLSVRRVMIVFRAKHNSVDYRRRQDAAIAKAGTYEATDSANQADDASEGMPHDPPRPE